MTPVEISYDAATAPKGMFRHLRDLIGYPGVIARNATLLGNFFRRDLLGRFRGSYLGIFWVLVQPMFLFAVYFAVFGFLFAPKGMTGSASIPFALYLFSGIIAFTAFSDSTTRSCNCVLENGNLVKKVAFPCELLPIPNILASLVAYFVGAAVLLIVGLPTGNLSLSVDILALPVILIVQFVMCLGFGLLLAALQVLVRDTSHLYSIGSQAWFFMSPVFWPYNLIQGKMLTYGLGDWAWILEANPVYGLIQAHRIALGFPMDGQHGYMATKALHPEGKLDAAGDPILVWDQTLPGVWYHTGHAAVFAVFFLLVGYTFFMSRKRKFSDLV